MGVSPGAVSAWVVLPGHTDLTEPGLGINLVTRNDDNDAREVSCIIKKKKKTMMTKPAILVPLASLSHFHWSCNNQNHNPYFFFTNIFRGSCKV